MYYTDASVLTEPLEKESPQWSFFLLSHPQVVLRTTYLLPLGPRPRVQGPGPGPGPHKAFPAQSWALLYLCSSAEPTGSSQKHCFFRSGTSWGKGRALAMGVTQVQKEWALHQGPSSAQALGTPFSLGKRNPRSAALTICHFTGQQSSMQISEMRPYSHQALSSWGMVNHV